MKKMSIENVGNMAKDLFEWTKKDSRRALLVIVSDENGGCSLTCTGSELDMGVAIAACLEKNRELIPVLSGAVKAAKDYILRTEMERP